MNARSAWLSPNGQTREDTRVVQTGAVTPATNIRGRSGVFPGSSDGAFRITGFALTGTSGGMTATVGVGRGVVQAEDDRGAYPVAVTEPVTLTFGGGTDQSRRDLVVLRIYDDQYDASGRTEAVVEVIPGTPTATDPAPPATPAAALPLYTVLVPANASAGNGGIIWASTATVTDLRTSVVAVGGILPTENDSRTGAYPGQYRDTATALQRWNGTVWIPYPRETGGIAPGGALTNGSYAGQYRDGPNGQLQRWNGTAWLPAVPGPAFVNSFNAGYTSSTTYTAALTGTPVSALTLSFTAPPSGAVLLGLGSRMETPGSTTASAYLTPQVTLGTTVIWTAVDQYAAVYSGSPGASVATTVRLGSLTAGATYTVTAMHRSTASGVNCWFANAFLRVDPLA
ncbi:hypothetical protein OG787_18055 [Streptomyces sp. NBC_00075]|uniref:hypothetical protein n=1 Tax=Streptomyces sp. NBC_00075 TaxID=2975641 RepID=UPI0032561820